MKKFALALMASAAMILGFSAMVSAYPPGSPPPTVSDPTPAPGSTFTVEVGCSPVGASVNFTLNSVPPQTVTVTCVARSGALAGGSMLVATPTPGVARATFTAPTTPGTYTVSYDGAAVGSVTVTVESATTPGGGLPAAGSNGTSTMTIVAIGLFAVGACLFGVSQFRRRSATT